MKKSSALTLALFFCFASVFGTEAGSTDASPGRKNVQTLVPLKNKVAADGVFSPGEWAGCASDHVFVSQTTGKKAGRDTFVFYGYDSDNFYFCHLGAVPPKPQTLSSLDEVEWILTGPDGQARSFRFTPEGGKNLPDGVVYRSDLYGKLNVPGGFPQTAKWVAEMAIPWSVLGLDRAPEKAVYRLQVRRFWQNPEEIAVLDIPRLVFRSDAPMMSGRIALYGVSARIGGGILNPSDERRTFHVDVMIKSLEAPLKLNKQIAAGPKAAVDLAEYFMVGGATDRNLDVSVTDDATGEVIYARELDWNESTGIWFRDPDPPIVMDFGLCPSQKRLIAKVETAAEAKLADVRRVEFKIINADDVVIQVVEAERKGPGLYFKDWRYPDLSLGRYTLKAELFRENKPVQTFLHTFRIMNFDWQNTEVGMARTVPSPFRPLSGEGNEVHALLTGYRADGVFWNAVFAKEENILAGPVELYCGGKELKTEKESWEERSADRAVRVSEHSAPGLRLQVRHEYEFDGVCKTTLAFQPDPDQTVEGLYIDIPLKPEFAKLYHHVGFGIRSNPSEWIPAGEGRVWSLPWEMLKYPSCIWFGETYRGISFFTDMTPPFFDNRTGFVSHEFLRSPDCVTLRIHLSPPDPVPFRPFEWVCGFQPTPVKPRPRGFRRYGGSMWTEKLPDTHMLYVLAWYKHFFSDISRGQVLVPYANDYSWLDYIFSGRQNEESRDQIMDRIRALMKKHDLTDEKWERLFGDGHDRASVSTRMRQGAIFTRGKELGLYLNPRGGYRCWAESDMYDAEWMYSGYHHPDDNHYHRHPVKSYVDMLLFKTRNFLRRYPQCKGLYFDNLYPSRKSSLFWGARELSPGVNTFTGDIFFMREMVKRTLVMSQEEKRFLLSDPGYAWLVGHMTDANIIPVMGLLSVNLGWEMKFGRQDYQDRFSEAFHLVQSLGTQSGTAPIAITQTSGTREERMRQHRSLYAVGFAFDMLNFWDPGSREEDGSPVFNEMQRLVREFGYGQDIVEHFPGYEPEKNPVSCTPVHVRITTLKRNDGKIMLLIGNLGEASTVKLSFSGMAVSGLRNAETGEEIRQNEFGLPKHDCAVLTGNWTENDRR